MGLYLPMKHVSSGMHPWSSRIVLTVLTAVVFVLSGCGPAGGGDEATGGATEPVIEAPQATATAVPSPRSTESSATPVATAPGPVIGATPRRILDRVGASATPDAGTPAERPAPVLGRQRPAPSDNESQNTPGTDRVPTGTPASAPGDGTTGALPTSPTASDTGDGTAETEQVTDAAVVDSCTPAEVPEFGGPSNTFVVVENLYFRTGPGTDCDRIGDGVLEVGTALTATSDTVVREGQNMEWVRVEVDGQEGWVAADFIEPQPEQE